MEMLNAIADSVFEIIICCDLDGIIKMCNSEAVNKTEYSMDELAGKNIEELFLDKNGSIMGILNSSKESMVSYQTNLYRKNKTCFPVNMRITYVDNAKVYVVAAMDISEYIAAHRETEFVNEKIKEAMKVKDEFTANVTHELRTPVNGIKGHTQYLMMTELTKDQRKELEIINECCLNMEKLINNILDFAKLEAGKFTLSERDFDFRECIKYISETNGKLIEDKGLRFVVNVDDTIPQKLNGDDFRLIQIMNNLLSNALKFTSKGYIAVEVTKSMQVGRDVELFFMVMDTGIGIPPEKKDALFKSFTQVDASISRTYGGTGLGLAITKQLVELMKGSIRLESELGKGSSFTFSVRMRIPDSEEVTEESGVTVHRIDNVARARQIMEEANQMNCFGTPENKAELKKLMEKLLLCMELENFEKAEQFADSVKSLVLDGPPELKQLTFRMQMMIRKEDGEHAMEYYEQLSSKLSEAYADE